MLRERVLSMFEFPSRSRIVPHSKTWICDRSQQWREIMELRMEEEETKELRFQEEESKGSFSKWELDRWQHRILTRELRMVEKETRELRMVEEESKSSLSKMGWRQDRRQWRFQERKLVMQKGLANVGEPKSSPSKTAECDSDVPSPTVKSLRLRLTKTVGVSPCSSKKPVGLQCALSDKRQHCCFLPERH